MNYKQMYKETQKWIKSIYPELGHENRMKAEALFPELKSEDEKIRKELLEHCKNQAEPYIQTGNKCPQIQSWIAWLEKQGEQKSDSFCKENCKGFQETGKCFADGDCKAKREAEQKPVWSEEDESMLDEAIYLIRREPYRENDVESIVDWVESLKDRVQHQNTYNPYKAVVESIAEMCKHYDKATDLQDFYDNVKVKCKDAKEYDKMFPQNTWKPSDEQMEALKAMAWYCDVATSFDAHKQRIVESLYSELKKLKEE